LLIFGSLLVAAGSFTCMGMFLSGSPEWMDALSWSASWVLSVCNGGTIRQDVYGLADFDLPHRNVALAANVLWSAAALAGAIFIFFAGGLFVATFRRQFSSALQRRSRIRIRTLSTRLFFYGFLVLVNWVLVYGLVANIPRDVTLYDGLAYAISTILEVAGAMAGPALLAHEFFARRILLYTPTP
jgi:hypothetical protein